jgi:hypothetical protein
VSEKFDNDAMRDALRVLFARHSPGWTLASSDLYMRGPGLAELRGALPGTNHHVASMRLALDTGELTFVDEDWRDGSDIEERRVTITAEELAHVHATIG